jgi:gluconate kinase
MEIYLSIEQIAELWQASKKRHHFFPAVFLASSMASLGEKCAGLKWPECEFSKEEHSHL